MKKFFKTAISLLLTSLLAFSLTGCGLREAVAKTVSELLEPELITDHFITGTIDSEACKYTNRSLDLIIDLDEEKGWKDQTERQKKNMADQGEDADGIDFYAVNTKTDAYVIVSFAELNADFDEYETEELYEEAVYDLVKKIILKRLKARLEGIPTSTQQCQLSWLDTPNKGGKTKALITTVVADKKKGYEGSVCYFSIIDYRNKIVAEVDLCGSTKAEANDIGKYLYPFKQKKADD